MEVVGKGKTRRTPSMFRGIAATGEWDVCHTGKSHSGFHRHFGNVKINSDG